MTNRLLIIAILLLAAIIFWTWKVNSFVNKPGMVQTRDCKGNICYKIK